jgi:hypothetical protein
MRVFLTTLFLLSTIVPAAAQRPPAGPVDPLSPAGNPPSLPQDDARTQALADMQERQRVELNRRRQEQLKHDTDKLLQLATELKSYVDQTNQNILSLDVVKKAEEIEKLAKSVRDKMKASYY